MNYVTVMSSTLFMLYRLVWLLAVQHIYQSCTESDKMVKALGLGDSGWHLVWP